MSRAVMLCVRSLRALITLEMDANCARVWESATGEELSAHFFFLLSGLVDVLKRV